jgi:hypothetical protein
VSGDAERGRIGRVLDPDTEHTVKNHLALIVGYCELLLAETPPEDTRHADLLEISQAARELMVIFKRDTPR